MRSLASSPRLNRSQQGGALLVMLVILVIGITTAFVTSLSQTAITNKRNQATADALVRAKEALIGYALSYGDTHPDKTHGYLPCPDEGTLTEGTAPSECGAAGVNELGRLPWRTLGVSPLSDGTGECLWYAVSGNYGNKSSSLTMNWDTPASLKLHDRGGNEIAPGEVVALVIAPGAPVSGNSDRSGSAAPTCGGNYTAAAYLDNDTTHGLNNADGITGKFILPHEHRDANGNVTLTVNDQIVYITRQDIWDTIQRRIVREAGQCLESYASNAGGKYPWASSVSTSTSYSQLFRSEGGYGVLFGRIPKDPGVQLESTPANIATMQQKFDLLWSAMITYKDSQTWANFSNMRDMASDAENAANNVEDTYDGWPQSNPSLEGAADALGDAARVVENWTTYPSAFAFYAAKQDILDAANPFTAEVLSELNQAAGMPTEWGADCKLFSSKSWDHWKDLLFYQVANGYKPSNGSPTDCVSGGGCMSIEIGGQAQSAAYRAVLIGAGKRLTASRNTAVLGDYLEPDNVLPKDDVSKPYKTYRATDDGYQSNNDVVICVDC